MNISFLLMPGRQRIERGEYYRDGTSDDTYWAALKLYKRIRTESWMIRSKRGLSKVAQALTF